MSAAERLGADHGADHVAVDIDVAVRKPGGDALDGQVDAGMDAERKRRAVRRDLIEQRVEFPARQRTTWSTGPKTSSGRDRRRGRVR